MSTKARILAKALEAFNASGYGAVNLFELAKSMGMSRGNMTYHFKDKEAILKDLADQLWVAFEQARAPKSVPSFENLHHDAQLYYRLQQEYAFIFHDHKVLQHPLIASKLRELIDKSLKDIKTSIAFSIQVGNMKAEPIPGLYNNLAYSTWMIMFFWSSQQLIHEDGRQQDGEKKIWSLLLPHLTEKGLASFKKFFGEDYFKSLGNAFEMDMESYFTF